MYDATPRLILKHVRALIAETQDIAHNHGAYSLIEVTLEAALMSLRDHEKAVKAYETLRSLHRQYDI